MSERVGCARADGTLNIHAETETCEVCAGTPDARPDPPEPTPEWWDRFELALFGKIGNTWEAGKLAQVKALLSELSAASVSPREASPPDWRPIETLIGHDYVLLASPAHGRVIGGHIAGDVWHLVGVGCVTSPSERPTHWWSLPELPKENVDERERA